MGEREARQDESFVDYKETEVGLTLGHDIWTQSGVGVSAHLGGGVLRTNLEGRSFEINGTRDKWNGRVGGVLRFDLGTKDPIPAETGFATPPTVENSAHVTGLGFYLSLEAWRALGSRRIDTEERDEDLKLPGWNLSVWTGLTWGRLW